MKTDGSDEHKIYAGIVNNLILWNDYLFFTEEDKLVRINTNGTDKKIIYNGYAECVSISDSFIYFYDNYKECFNKIKIDGTEKEIILKGRLDYPIAYNKWIYYIDEENDGISKIKTDGTQQQIIGKDLPDIINVFNDYIYYYNFGDKIWRMKLDGTEDNIYLEQDRISTFSITNNALYYIYQTGEKYNEKGHMKLVMIDN